MGDVRSLGKQKVLRQDHGGNIPDLKKQLGLEDENLIDFSVNINPLGQPPGVLEFLKHEQPDVSVYPDPSARRFVDAASDRHGVTGDSIIVGAGAAELLYWLIAHIKPERVVGLEPAFGDYMGATLGNGGRFRSVALKESHGFALDWQAVEQAVIEADLLIIGHPNNPTGGLVDKKRLIGLADTHPDLLILVDEAFIDFAALDECSVVDAAVGRSNIISLRSLTKIYSIPNLRLGYLVGPERLMREWKRARPPWPLGEAQLEVAAEALHDREFLALTRGKVAELRESLYRAFTQFSWLKPFRSEANFLLVKILTEELDDWEILERLAAEGIIVRACRSFTVLGDRFFRVAVRDYKDNQLLLKALRRVENDAVCNITRKV